VDDDGGGGIDNFCFIATAAHVSLTELQVEVLRKFLNGFLRINRAGSQH